MLTPPGSGSNLRSGSNFLTRVRFVQRAPGGGQSANGALCVGNVIPPASSWRLAGTSRRIPATRHIDPDMSYTANRRVIDLPFTFAPGEGILTSGVRWFTNFDRSRGISP